MKFIKKISLVYSLQILAVFLLFFFPGFSTHPGNVELNSGKAADVNNIFLFPGDTLHPLQKTGDTFPVHQNREPVAGKFILITGNR